MRKHVVVLFPNFSCKFILLSGNEPRVLLTAFAGQHHIHGTLPLVQRSCVWTSSMVVIVWHLHAMLSLLDQLNAPYEQECANKDYVFYIIIKQG